MHQRGGRGIATAHIICGQCLLIHRNQNKAAHFIGRGLHALTKLGRVGAVWKSKNFNANEFGVFIWWRRVATGS